MREINFIVKLYFILFVLIVLVITCLFTAFYKLPELEREAEYLNNVLKDWHDFAAILSDSQRIGIGEQGQAAYIANKTLQETEQRISLQNGFNGMLSDLISVNRSLPDIRNKGCRTKRYLANLPTVSIVIPFHNEYFSALVRSVHSLFNRTPPELLQEVILVDDASVRAELTQRLDHYIVEHFRNVRIIRLKNRTGLIGARLAGARAATADVLIFLDSHIEANYNWLPPLLEPIALNKRTAVCPFIDVIDDKTFAYSAQDEGARGAFNWIFDYKRLPLLPENLIDRTKPFESPVMAGGLFAISAEFFWELGGYDEGLDIWGGEQYELSFKIWMCGGQLLDAPCSRVGHIYRGPQDAEPSPRDGDFLHKNYKRVAEVWMDEYKEFLYNHDNAYEEIDAGNLTKQKALRDQLKCKSFKWYMENVAFDLTKTYPPVEPPEYAHGAIQSLADKQLCVDTLSVEPHSEIGLFNCADKLERPQRNQDWELSAHRDLRMRLDTLCLQVNSSKKNAPVLLWECREEGGNQFWYYDPVLQWLVFERNGTRCLEAVPSTRSLRVNKCHKKNPRMKWSFAFVNMTALNTFFVDVPDVSYAF